MTESKQRCNTCILPIEYPGISFNGLGECNYCKQWKRKWEHIDFTRQTALLENILDKYRSKSKPYDCLIGLSGGKDSCYAAYVLKKKNMNPLGCTFDNGFLTETALHNIKNTVKALSIGHVFVRHNSDYINTLYRHFLLTAGEFCSVCNVGIRSTLYRTAKSYEINLIVSGQSSRTEANSPKEFFSSSSGYFQNIAKTTFSKREIDGFLYVTQLKRIIWHLQQSPFYLQLPSYMPWREEEFTKEMEENLNWKGAFGEQHMDCRMSDAKEYLKLKKFGVTELTAKLSSLVRDKQLSRDEALALAQQHISKLEENEFIIKEQLKKEFNLSEDLLYEAIQASHIPYTSKTETLLSEAKNLYEGFRFRKKN